MKLNSHDINGGTLKSEGEEIYAPVVKLVKASDFHSDNRGFESHQECNKQNGDQMIVAADDRMIVGKREEEIGYGMKKDWTIGFNTFTGNNAIVNGRTISGLGLRQN